jgi:hypothetical protein
MDGWQHAGSGVIAGGALCLAAGMDLPHIALGALTMGGFALLPDADHGSATFARSAGPVSWLASGVIHGVTGGHRGAMHWAIGIAAFSAGFWAAGQSTSPDARLAAASVLALLFASCLHVTRLVKGRWRLAKGLSLPNRALCLVLGAGLGALAVVAEPGALWWLCAAGMALHDLEDLTTGNGPRLAYNFFWPFSRWLWRGDKPHGTGYREAARRSRDDGAGLLSRPPRAGRGARSPRPGRSPARRSQPRRRTPPSRRGSRTARESRR